MFGIVHEEKELPCINMSMKLQGYLLGYDVLQGGVIVKSHRYSVPVKNLVVNTGKDFLMKVSNSPTTTVNESLTTSVPRFGYSSAGASGVLAYCGRGSSSTAATATDTALGAQIGNLTNTFYAGDPNTGTRFDRENGKVIMRVTHDHETESTDRNINELGWFGKQSATTIMFSRVVLPSTITVLNGQVLRTVYQLEVSITPIASTSCAPTITGWTTDGYYRWECAFPATSTTFTTHTMSAFSLFDVVTTAGTSGALQSAAYTDGQGLNPICSPAAYSAVTMYGTAQSFNSFGTRVANPAAGSSVFHAFSGSTSSGTATCTVQNYVTGNYYRDRTLVFEPGWPGYTSISVYAMRLFGLMYIFDNPQTKTNTQRLTLTYRISVS